MSTIAGGSASTRAAQKVNPADHIHEQVPSMISSDIDERNSDDSESDGTVSEPDSDDLDGQRPVQTTAKISSSNVNKKKVSFPKYRPPPGMEPLSVSVSFKNSPFEYDEIASKPGIELWAIRTPADFKPARLGSLNLRLSGTSLSGDLKTKSTTYDLTTANTSQAVESSASGPSEGGGEMPGLSLLVPRLAHGGKLVRAPVAISRHLLLTPVEDELTDHHLPSIVTSTSSRTKRTQPEHLFKFRNRAFGFDTPGPKTTTRGGHFDDYKDDQSFSATPANNPVKKSKSMGVGDDQGDGKHRKRKSEIEGSSPVKKKRKAKEQPL